MLLSLLNKPWLKDEHELSRASPAVVTASVIMPSALRLRGGGALKWLTLLWYPEWLGVPGQHLVHDPPELVEDLQALVLPHAGVVEAGQPRLWKRQGEVELRSAAHRSNADSTQR